MNDILIRKANPDDLNSLLAFEQDLIKYERPFDPTLKADPVHYYDLDAMLTATNVHLVVAETENRIVASGYARIDESKPYLKYSKHAYLGFMYVLPGYRGRGINQLIMAVLKQWASANNISEFRLEVYYDNLSAIKAYEKFGFKKHMIEMRFNLNDH